MSATSEYRLKRDWCGRFVLQVKEIRHHMNDLNGSGYYDEFTTCLLYTSPSPRDS